MNRILPLAALWLGLAASAHAQATPNWPMRELIVQSDAVVLAAPAAPGRFKAVRVLLGTAPKEGDVFEIDDLSSYDLTVAAEGASGRKPARVAEALLFLGPKKAEAPAPRFPLTPSGMRLLTTDGTLYYAERPRNPGPYVLHLYDPGVVWDDLVRKAAADAGEVSHVRSLKEIADPRRRNEALLDWVERRRREFGGGLGMGDGEEPTFGWGSLEQDVFQWILESRIPEDCWAAVKLYAELNQGANPRLEAPAFGTRAGRALLLAVALDEGALLGHRARAAELLALPRTLWPPRAERQPDVEPLDEKEQTALIDGVTPLLKDPTSRMRAAAAHALLEAGAPQPGALQEFRTQRALAALTAAYKEQPPGAAHDALAEAVWGVGGPKQWEERTGNGHGVVAVLSDPDCKGGADFFCWLVVRPADDLLHDDLSLLLERFDKKQKVQEVEASLKGSPRPSPRPDGGQAGAALYVSFSMADLPPGDWQVRVKGVAADKTRWLSEPRLLRLAPPPMPGQPTPDPSAPRIVFDP